MYKQGDILQVRLVPGRIERRCFIVQRACKVQGGGYRYAGKFPGFPTLAGKVYSEDVIGKWPSAHDKGD